MLEVLLSMMQLDNCCIFVNTAYAIFIIWAIYKLSWGFIYILYARGNTDTLTMLLLIHILFTLYTPLSSVLTKAKDIKDVLHGHSTIRVSNLIVPDHYFPIFVFLILFGFSAFGSIFQEKSVYKSRYKFFIHLWVDLLAAPCT